MFEEYVIFIIFFIIMGFYFILVYFNFFRSLLSYIVAVYTAYYKNISKDYKKLNDSIYWAKQFFILRFTRKGFLGRLIAVITFLSIFTAYPIMLLLTILHNFLDCIIRYFFLPFDILFKDYLFKVKFSSGNKATLEGLYRFISIIKANCIKLKLMFIWLLGCFDKIYWANRLIRRWNKIDDFLYHSAIAIEYYIYFLIASARTGISFYYWLKRKVRYFIFSRSGHENIKIRLRFKYRLLKTYILKLFHYFIFILKWFFYYFKILLKFFYFYTKSFLVIFFWFIVLVLWEFVKCFFYGISIILRIPIIFYRLIRFIIGSKMLIKPKRSLIKDNLERYKKTNIKDKDKII
jgi:hypothetical protein